VSHACGTRARLVPAGLLTGQLTHYLSGCLINQVPAGVNFLPAFTLVSCLSHCLTMKLEVIYFSEMSADFQWAKRCYIHNDRTFQEKKVLVFVKFFIFLAVSSVALLWWKFGTCLPPPLHTVCVKCTGSGKETRRFYWLYEFRNRQVFLPASVYASTSSIWISLRDPKPFINIEFTYHIFLTLNI
jgi:hypothetical protein